MSLADAQRTQKAQRSGRGCLRTYVLLLAHLRRRFDRGQLPSNTASTAVLRLLSLLRKLVCHIYFVGNPALRIISAKASG